MGQSRWLPIQSVGIIEKIFKEENIVQENI